MIEHTRIPFADLVFLDDNPRTRTPEGLQRMADDIRADPTFFDNRPVLVNLTAGIHQVYAGDLRAHAAHDVLHWPDIPCNVERDVPPEVMRRRAIVDNLHRETWAADILTTSWASDDLAAWGLTPDKWGDDPQPDTPGGGFTATEDDYEQPDTITTDIVPGDLFHIGPHRLLCGDSKSADDVAKVMCGDKADVVIADPPYGIGLRYVGVMANNTDGSISGDDEDFDPSMLSLLGCDIQYVFGADYFIEKLPNRKGLCVWAKAHSEKENLVFGAAFETFWRSHREKREIWFENRINALPENEHKHPTQKPVSLIARCITESETSGIILDPFLGSGTTMVAAHQLHRRCYGIEIDPKYCQVILDRMLKLDPTLIILRNGQPYQGK